MEVNKEIQSSHKLYSASCKPQLVGSRYCISKGEKSYPEAFLRLANPPDNLYIIGSLEALQEGIAIVGARKATPYGLSCAKRFGRMAAKRGIVIISGGALGCDSAAHRAALAEGTPTVVFLGGGCDQLYPARNKSLFQDIINAGGAIVSEQSWNHLPKPYTFRARNRLIASLAKATLIVEAGLPSGTFSTADEALQANRDVLVVPGAITSKYSQGANRLLYQGAIPIVDDESFLDVLFALFGCLQQQTVTQGGSEDAQSEREQECTNSSVDNSSYKDTNCNQFSATQSSQPQSFEQLHDALCAEPMNMQELYELAQQIYMRNDLYGWISKNLMIEKKKGNITRYPDGRYGAVLSENI